MQILMNLVSNAIKFTSSDGSVTIYAHVSGDNYIIKVIDTGCGISEGNIILITNPFTRAELSPLLAHEEGTGLGLSIVKSLVDLHSGKLEIKSNLGEGTTVTVTIPFQTASTELHTQDQSTLQLTKFV